MLNNPFKDKNSPTTCLSDKWSGAAVIRPDDMSRTKYERDHYSVSKQEYELDHYPTYCGGPCALLSSSTAQKTFDVAEKTNPGRFIMEDILFTGIIRVKSNLPKPNIQNGVCSHFNDADKVNQISVAVFNYCRSVGIKEADCLINGD